MKSSPKTALTSPAYTPSFEVDYTKCGSTSPLIQQSGNTVIFGDYNGNSASGRVVSTSSYKNITKISAMVDLSKLSQNFVNASFYLVSNPTNPSLQPKGDNYCDAGGSCSEWNCREIDMLETNGSKITQTTMHLGNGGEKAAQRFEYSFAQTADNSCFNYAAMLASPTPTNGLHSLVGTIDMSKPFRMTTEFTLGDKPSMRTTFNQNSKNVIVYDTSVGTGAEGSGTVSLGDLNTLMANGCWLVASQWQGYSPKGPSSAPWWNDTCSWGLECGANSYWGLSDVSVTAD